VSGQVASSPAVRVLVADDDASHRTLYGYLVQGIPGVSSVVAVEDGVEAERIAGELALHVAILDLNMPRLDGVEAALRLSATQPSLRIALHSSDPDELRQRAHGLGLPLFGKLEVDRLAEWVEDEAMRWSAILDAVSACGSSRIAL
jgi:CheY-like chemotaxis protein